MASLKPDVFGGDVASKIADEPIDTSACDREPIHLAGAIQPHGVMLIADQAGTIVAGAGDIEGRLSSDWLHRSLQDVLGQIVDVDAIRENVGTSFPLGLVAGRTETLDASAFATGDHFVVELEPSSPVSASATMLLFRLDAIGTNFDRAVDLQMLCDRAAHAFRELTGFDRVMIYRFLDDEAGTVVAESRDEAQGSFLNHHFPASDIPRQARALYVRNRVRVIPDIAYEPAVIRPSAAGMAGLDLSDSTLRSVSPIHIQYLRNMGVSASASVSIVKDGLLWGLVACHNSTPKRLSVEAKMACRALAGALGRQIRAKEEAMLYRERIGLRSAEEAIVIRMSGFSANDPLTPAVLDDVRKLPGADGFAVLNGDNLLKCGTCPDDGEIRDLAKWVIARSKGEPFVSHALGEVYAPAAEYRHRASGLVAVGRPHDSVGIAMWFRAEQLEVVNWAGNPHKVATGPMGELTPRKSFELWGETVRGRSRRWSLSEVEAISRFRRTLLELRQAARLRELNRDLTASVDEKEALLSEKDHLLREVNHRVQNSLQLVQAFLGLQAQAGNDEVLAGHLKEAQRRLSAVALVHRRLYQGDQVDTVDLARYLEELVSDMRSAMGPEWQQGILLDLAPVLLSADRAVHVGLVLTELVINANKYAYEGEPGPLLIALEQHGNTFRLIVADQGRGGSSTREGFGTRMMNAMIQRLGGTMERQDNRPGLRVVVTAPIDQR